MPTVLWIVGEPGTGKTSIARELLGPPPYVAWDRPKWTIAGELGPWGPMKPSGTAAVGHYKGTPFDGADTVPYNGAAEALDTWHELLAGRARLTILDGDRFSSSTALGFFRNPMKYRVGHRLKCVHLDDPEVAATLRRTREVGHKLKPQAAAFVKGRRTKAANFADRFPAGDVLHVRNLRCALDLLAGPVTLAKEITTWLENNR